MNAPEHDTRGQSKVGGFRIWRDGHVVRVTAPFGGGSLSQAGVDRLISALAACRDVLPAEPDPAEVAELAAVILSELYPEGVEGVRPSESDLTAARTALRWMRDKQEAGHA